MQINLRRIKAERVFKKISQAQMAKKLGISRTSYAKKEEALERLLLKVQIQDANYINRI
ncbi:helix-turn-helix domain-containing protein [Lactobacillus iners]|uniref:helix-turn-helix domain-containing protein n=1 Tax=Lactobacillus iners TaxID=147802 RepID=UPI003EBCCC4D